jgi:lysophospholipase L1-like esterase
MNNARNALLLGLVLSLAVTGGASAQVDFSKYVAVGDSLTAGYASSGLAVYYQDYSYPLQIARKAQPNPFQQPTVAYPGINPVLILQRLAPAPVLVPAGSTPGSPTNATLSGPYNNLGVPGARVNDLLTRTGDIKKLAAGTSTADTVMYDLILRDGKNPAIAQAVAAAGTFYTVWAGNNDVLGAAIYGLALDGVTLTPVAAFQTQFATLLGALKTNRPAAKAVVATIPDVTAIPFVTAVAPYNYTPTGVKFYYLGENGPLTDGDYLTLSASSLLAQGYGIPGTGKLLPEGAFVPPATVVPGVILRKAEIAAIKARTAELNAVIKAVAGSNGYTVWDANAFFAEVKANGISYSGIKLTASFLTGGLFSYDGVHPQRIGYAVIANELIKTINATYGTAVSLVDLKPLLLGATSVTSVEAPSVIYTREAWRSLAEIMVPDVKADWTMPGEGRRLRQRAPVIRERGRKADLH